MKPTRLYLESLARKAGALLRAGLGQHNQVDYKGAIDLVTEMDQRSEAFLLGEIGRDFPSHRVISEESGGLPGDERFTWYVDPLDGTTNYAHGVPIFSASLAFYENGQGQLGAVYDPMQDECFSAERGKGAWLNGQAIRVSATSRLEHSLLATGFPYDIRSNPENNLDFHALFSLHARAVRRLGSAALDLCYLAAGRFDGYWELRLSTWDVAAGALVAIEAGARVTSLDGDPDFMKPPILVLAANPQIYPQMLKLLQSRKKP